jgi:hypothetical protein
MSNQLCDYGCGQKATHQFKNGKRCCSDNVSKCLFIKRIIGDVHRGAVISNKTREAVRKAKLGKKDSKETRQKKSDARKGSKNPMYRKKHSVKTRRIISEKAKGRRAYNKLNIEILREKYPFFSKIEEMRYNPNKPDEKEIQVHCKNHNCKNSKEKGGWFTPTSEQIHARKNMLEREGKDYSYFYCSIECKQACPLYRMHGADPFKKQHLSYTFSELQVWKDRVKDLDNSKCQICGTNKDIHVHHIIPVKLEPFFSLDPENGICLCEKCHFKYGHKDECEINNIKKRCEKGN